MDPVSIAASAVALTQTAGVIASSLAGFVRALQTADSRITALCDELAHLTNFLQSVEKTLDGCHKFDFALMEDDLWQQSDVVMADCKATLKELDTLVTKIKDTAQPKGFGWRTRAVVDLSLHGTAISASRDKIHQSNWALQTVLNAMTVSLSFRNHASQEAILAKLTQLKTSIDETIHASSRPAGGFSRGLNHHPESHITRNMRHLAQAAGHFYSAANSTASSTRGDRSIGHTPSYQSAAAVSIMGDFPDSRRERVEQFIHDSHTPFRGPTITSVPSQSASSRFSRPPSVLIPNVTSASALARGSSNTSLDEDDVDAEFERLFFNGLQELATASMKNRDYHRAIEYLQDALQREGGSSFTNANTDFRQLQVQLAFCHFLQGTWRLAEPIVTKLAQSKAGQQDLAVCSLLHALSLAYLSEYQFDDALTACKKALPGKKRLCKANGTDCQEYREALALLATIFQMERDYIRAEVLRRQLPHDFIYIHPANEMQYLQSKSHLVEPIFSDDDPQQSGLVELDAGPSVTAEGQSQGVARNGTVHSSNATSLRVKILEYQRYEEDTMKEVLFVHPAEPQAAEDADDEASPVSEKGSLRRRLSHLFGSVRVRRVTSDTLTTNEGSESPASDMAPVSVSPVAVSPVSTSPVPTSPSESQWDGIWFNIKRSKTLLRKRPREGRSKFPSLKSGNRQKKAFKLVNMEKITQQPPTHAPEDNLSEFSYMPSENNSISPIADYSGPAPSMMVNETGPTSWLDAQSFTSTHVSHQTDQPDPTLYTQTQIPELADEETEWASAPYTARNVNRNQDLSSSGQSIVGAARKTDETNGFTANHQANAHATNQDFDSKASPHAGPDILPRTIMDAATILASLKTMKDGESLRGAKLDLRIILRRLEALNKNQFLIPDVQKAIQRLEQTEALEYDQAHDSGYDTMDDNESETESGPIWPFLRGDSNLSSKSPDLKRAFSWKMGSEDAYMARNFQFQHTDDTSAIASHGSNNRTHPSTSTCDSALGHQEIENIEGRQERLSV
ncbi:hypothetical protein QQX98_003354 [Neonectria punicea]|uniref:Fungal N-terminal domain-containing protein n=1 Tax=Neonectria punicea TaxID=979145 RepID=A0ABR1HEZ5_9HYPO